MKKLSKLVAGTALLLTLSIPAINTYASQRTIFWSHAQITGSTVNGSVEAHDASVYSVISKSTWGVRTNQQTGTRRASSAVYYGNSAITGTVTNTAKTTDLGDFSITHRNSASVYVTKK